MKKTTKVNTLTFASLIVIFIIYNSLIYNSDSYIPSTAMTKKAVKGEILWQNNNCWSCHQVYGLGGYLGPELTNIYSNPNKGPDYIKAMLNSGVKSMPKFNFTEEEKLAITEYLKIIDKSGAYPNISAEIERTGWVNFNNNNE
jgi:nitric oxide reductase subunit C